MWDPNASIQEKQKMEQYMKEKILETFNLFATDKKGYVDKKEIPYIMRYLGKFPSEAQVSKTILPQIEEDEPSESIKYQKFEPFMIQVLKSNEYDPDDTDTLLAAFRQLDEEKKGYIEIDTLKQRLTTMGIQFRPLEIEDFIRFATNGDPNATVIYYEDYILRLQFFIEKHMESVTKQYNPEK
ncbi:unnamed protein product [Paramecium primaurelia]|uniref:EF-hand domain-containing protein n=1 Tax=Paramecium primaurelia TaxID=5886 RepID=A0A8S1N7Q2_PARPR|nr:unnamed protein product [Paramecium primaurelia]